MVSMGAYMYFRGSSTDGLGSELWRSDGTAAGTTLVHDSYPGNSSGLPTPLGVVGGNLLYVVHTGPTPGLWKTNGTAAGTYFVCTFPSNPNDAVNTSTAVYVGNSQGLWRTDGTAAGTVLVSGISTNISDVEVVGTDVYGLALQSRIFRVAAATPTAATQVFSSSTIRKLTSFNSKLYFENTLASGANEIWSWSPSNTAGTAVVSTFSPNWIYPTLQGVFSNKLYYNATSSSGYHSLSRIYTSGYSETIFATNAPYASFYGMAATASGSAVFAMRENSAATLYRSNETQLYCERIFFSPNTIDAVSDFLSVGDSVYFNAYNSATDRSDPFVLTQTATLAVPIGEAGNYGGRFVVNNRFVFTGEDPTANTIKPYTYVDRTDRASISGTIWQDRDADGTRDTNDPMLTGRTVWLDTDNDGVLHSGEPQTIVNAQGRYYFADLTAGTYRVRQQLPASWISIAPNVNLRTVTVAGGTAYPFNDFTSRISNTGVVTGTAFDDFNRDGIKNGIDRFVPTSTPRTIFADTNNNASLDAGEPSAITGLNGVFTLNDVPSGTPRLRQVLGAGWVQSTPATSPYVMTLGDAATLSGVSFGADPPPASLTLLGRIFVDTNHGNTYYNASATPPLVNHVVFIDANLNGVFDTGETTATSDSEGLFSFSALDYGSYVVLPRTLSAGLRLGRQLSVTLLASTATSSPLILPIYKYLQFQQAAFSADTRALTLNFDVMPRITSTSVFTLTNLETGAVLPGSVFTSAYTTPQPTGLILSLTSTTTLPDARYRLTAPATSVTTYYGSDPLASGLSIEFFILTGDANRDRVVNFDDLLILAQNYGQSGRTFSQGNFNYSADGLVDFSDLLLLAQRYGTSLLSSERGSSIAKRRSLTDDVLA